MSGPRMPRLADELPDIDSIRQGCDLVRSTFQIVRGEIGRAVVGQRRVVTISSRQCFLKRSWLAL